MHRSEFIGVKKWPRICRLELFFVPGRGSVSLAGFWAKFGRTIDRKPGNKAQQGCLCCKARSLCTQCPKAPSPTRKATSRRFSLAWWPPNGVPIDFGGFYLGGPPCSENCMMLLLHSKENKTEMHKRKRNAAKSTQAPTAQRSAC